MLCAVLRISPTCVILVSDAWLHGVRHAAEAVLYNFGEKLQDDCYSMWAAARLLLHSACEDGVNVVQVNLLLLALSTVLCRPLPTGHLHMVTWHRLCMHIRVNARCPCCETY